MKSYRTYAVLLCAVNVFLCPNVSPQSKAAAPDEYLEINIIGRFTFSLPSTMEKVSAASTIDAVDDSIGETDGVRAWFYTRNKDAVRAAYQDPRMHLVLDYGRLAEGFSGFENELDIKQELVEISGRSAQIITFTSRGASEGHRYFAVMYFIGRGAGDGARPPILMWVKGKGVGEQEKAKKIFHSIKFLPPA